MKLLEYIKRIFIKYNHNNESSYIEFNDSQEAMKWGMDCYQEWGKTLSKEEKSSLSSYQGGSSGINGYLRYGLTTGYSSESYVKILIQNIISAFNSSPKISENIIVYRIHPDSNYYLTKYGFVEEPSFLSTSLYIKESKRYHGAGKTKEKAILKIHVPAGSTGLYLDAAVMPASKNAYETEILFPPNNIIKKIGRVYMDKVDKKYYLPCIMTNKDT